MKAKNIMVVNNDPDQLSILQIMLSKQGCDVTGIKTAESAMDSLKIELPDVVVTEIMIPVTNGIEMAKQIKAQYKDLPIVYVTAQDYNQVQERLDNTDDGFVTIPVDEQVIFDTIDEAVAKYQ